MKTFMMQSLLSLPLGIAILLAGCASSSPQIAGPAGFRGFVALEDSLPCEGVMRALPPIGAYGWSTWNGIEDREKEQFPILSDDKDGIFIASSGAGVNFLYRKDGAQIGVTTSRMRVYVGRSYVAELADRSGTEVFGQGRIGVGGSLSADVIALEASLSISSLKSLTSAVGNGMAGLRNVVVHYYGFSTSPERVPFDGSTNAATVKSLQSFVNSVNARLKSSEYPKLHPRIFAVSPNRNILMDELHKQMPQCADLRKLTSP